MSPAAKKQDPKEWPFEKAIARLEEIVAAMEGGELPLERMTAYFEEGHALIRQCGRQLDDVEHKIETLVRKGGEIVAEPFDAAPPPEDRPEPAPGGSLF